MVASLLYWKHKDVLFILLLQSDAWWLCRNPSFLLAFFHNKQLYQKVHVEWKWGKKKNRAPVKLQESEETSMYQVKKKKKGHHTARRLVVVSARWLAVQDSRANSGANSGAHGFWSALPFIWEKQTTCWTRTTELNRRLHLQQLERQMFPCGAATEPEGLMGCRIETQQGESNKRWIKWNDLIWWDGWNWHFRTVILWLLKCVCTLVVKRKPSQAFSFFCGSIQSKWKQRNLSMLEVPAWTASCWKCLMFLPGDVCRRSGASDWLSAALQLQAGQVSA